MDRDSLRHRLHATSLRQEVAGPRRPWRYLEVVDETGSTNSDLLARASAGEDINGLVLIAEQQTAGKGRMGRSWSAAQRAQLTLSVGVDAADVPTSVWGWLPLAAGLAVVDAVEATAGVQAALKWPNDVLAGDGKLAGVLSEVAGQAIVVGIGLNVTLRGDEVGEPLVTSLADLGVEQPDRTELAAELLRRLGQRVTGWRAGDQRADGRVSVALHHHRLVGARRAPRRSRDRRHGQSPRRWSRRSAAASTGSRRAPAARTSCVQMASLGLPIDGDPLYPNVIDVPADDFSAPLQLLAYSLEFDDPEFDDPEFDDPEFDDREFDDPVTGSPRRFVSRRCL